MASENHVTSSHPATTLTNLPSELLDLILSWAIALSRDAKNTVLQQRLVCKTFDRILSPYVLQTIQVDISRLSKLSNTSPKLQWLEPHAQLCQAMHLNLLLVREEGMK
jgi:hypothetical protein